MKKSSAAFLCLGLFLSACGSSDASLAKSELVFPSAGELIRESASSIKGGNPFGGDDGFTGSFEDQLLGETTSNSTTASTQSAPSQVTAGNTQTAEADFERYGIPCILEDGKDYVCPAIIEQDMNDITQGNLTVLGYFKKPVSDEVKEFGAKNGLDFSDYEMRCVTTSVGFTNQYIAGKNASILPRTYDYYDLNAPANGIKRTDILDREYLEYEVTYQGSKQPAYLWINKEWVGDTDYYEYRENAIFFVPAGYDGAVRGYVNPTKMNEDIKQYHPENDVLLFRLS